MGFIQKQKETMHACMHGSLGYKEEMVLNGWGGELRGKNNAWPGSHAWRIEEVYLVFFVETCLSTYFIKRKRITRHNYEGAHYTLHITKPVVSVWKKLKQQERKMSDLKWTLSHKTL